MTKRRVVITGMGMLTPLGLNVRDSWDKILRGQSGVSRITRFDASEYASQISGSVRDFNPESCMSAKEATRFDVFVQFGIAAAQEAFQDSGLSLEQEDLERIGVAIGSGIGGIPDIEKNHEALLNKGPRRISPFFIPGTIINILPGMVAIKYGMKGPNISVVTACSTSAHNIGVAARTIAYGDADIMLAGGSEMATCPMGVGGFAAMRALSTRNSEPEKASRPWDKDRDGFVLGDGAGVMVLEEYEHAKKRNARIYAELAGFGMSCDAHHITAPDPNASGAIRSMQLALKDAALTETSVDYINAHGTSTPLGDEIEVLAVKKVFGTHAYQLAMSSTKSMTGHLLGAAGAVEAIFSILAMRNNVAPPTINLDNPSESCDINLVPHTAQSRTIQVALSNSFGFGGTNSSLVFTLV